MGSATIQSKSQPIIKIFLILAILIQNRSSGNVFQHSEEVFTFDDKKYRRVDFFKCTGCLAATFVEGNCISYARDEGSYLNIVTFFAENNYVELSSGQESHNILKCSVSEYALNNLSFLFRPDPNSLEQAAFNFSEVIPRGSHFDNESISIATFEEFLNFYGIGQPFLKYGKINGEKVDNTDLINSLVEHASTNSSSAGLIYIVGNNTHFDAISAEEIIAMSLAIERTEFNQSLESCSTNISKLRKEISEQLNCTPENKKTLIIVSGVLSSIIVVCIIVIVILYLQNKQMQNNTANSNTPANPQFNELNVLQNSEVNTNISNNNEPRYLE